MEKDSETKSPEVTAETLGEETQITQENPDAQRAPQTKQEKNKNKKKRAQAKKQATAKSQNDDIERYYEGYSPFEKEIDWCITNIKMGLARQKPDGSQIAKSLVVLDVLESETYPDIKKKQQMKTTFGDYKSLINSMGYKDVVLFHREIEAQQKDDHDRNELLDELEALELAKRSENAPKIPQE
jgi:hypothetical protein